MSTIDRRGFVSLLTGVVGAALALPKELVFEPAKLYAPESVGTLAAMTEAFSWHLQEHLGPRTLYVPTPEPQRPGMDLYIPTPDLLASVGPMFGRIPEERIRFLIKRHVTLRLEPGEAVVSRRWLDPGADVMARALEKEGVTHIGRLDGPQAGAEVVYVESPRMCVRGVRLYNIASDEMHYRFDVLGGRAA